MVQVSSQQKAWKKTSLPLVIGRFLRFDCETYPRIYLFIFFCGRSWGEFWGRVSTCEDSISYDLVPLLSLSPLPPLTIPDRRTGEGELILSEEDWQTGLNIDEKGLDKSICKENLRSRKAANTRSSECRLSMPRHWSRDGRSPPRRCLSPLRRRCTRQITLKWSLWFFSPFFLSSILIW